MTEPFAQVLTVGKHANSLGHAAEVVEAVLQDHSRLPELYDCLFDTDAWVRMRAADSLEKICRQHPDWLLPYIDKFTHDLADNTQPSIQWHLAQIYSQVELTDMQRRFVLQWLTSLLSRNDIDWIVSANAMDTLALFAKQGFYARDDLVRLLKIQQTHKSNAVIKRATKLLAQIETVKKLG